MVLYIINNKRRTAPTKLILEGNEIEKDKKVKVERNSRNKIEKEQAKSNVKSNKKEEKEFIETQASSSAATKNEGATTVVSQALPPKVLEEAKNVDMRKVESKADTLPKVLDKLSLESVEDDDDKAISSRNSMSYVRSGKGRRTRHVRKAGGHVRFGSVEKVEFAVTVGLGSPDFKGNFPLTLDWSHTSPTIMDVHEYELHRIRKFQLHMDVRERYERLRLVTGLTDSKLVSLEQRRMKLQTIV